MNIIKTLETAEDWLKTYNDNLNSFGQTGFTKETYVEDCEALIVFCKSVDRYKSLIHIIDLRNALIRGLECYDFAIWGRDQALDGLKANIGYSLTNLLAKLRKAAELIEGRTRTLDINNDLKIVIRKNKAMETFSPFALSKIKPLTKLPRKPNKTDAIKALANNQVTSIKTERAVFDASIGESIYHRKGHDVCSMHLLSEIIDSSTYRVKIHENKMFFSPHSNLVRSGTICPELMNQYGEIPA